MSRGLVPRALAPALLVLLLAGCAVIPTSGPVRQNTAPPVSAGNDLTAVYRPNPPAPGADPEAIVSGFVLAAGAGGSYTVAKEFLTEDFAATWRPDAGVIVHTDPWSAKSRGADRVELRVPAAATVNGSGAYTPANPDDSGTSAPVSQTFRLERVNGQWRIAAGPNGVVLAQSAFLQRVYRPAVLRFWDPGHTRFVADLRWFPIVRQQAGSVLRALIAGPAAPLRGIAVSAFPESTRLIRPVTVVDGITTVSLAIPGQTPDRRTTDRMQQQIAGSLTPVSPASIRLVVNGRTAPVAPQVPVEQSSTQDPVVVAGARFGTLSTTGVREDTVLGPQVVKLRPRAVTVSSERRLAAVLSTGGSVALVDRERTRLIDSRRNLIAPTLDQQGWTYTVPSSDPNGLRAFDFEGKGRSVRVPVDLGGSAVLSIEASTDGARMLVLIQTDTGPAAYVAGILRDAAGTPVGLTSAHFPVMVGAPGAITATWVDPTQVAVLTSGTSVQNVVVQQVGGISSSLAPLSNASTIVGATSQANLRALVPPGDILQHPSNYWQSEFASSTSVSVLAVQR